MLLVPALGREQKKEGREGHLGAGEGAASRPIAPSWAGVRNETLEDSHASIQTPLCHTAPSRAEGGEETTSGDPPLGLRGLAGSGPSDHRNW